MNHAKRLLMFLIAAFLGFTIYLSSAFGAEQTVRLIIPGCGA